MGTVAKVAFEFDWIEGVYNLVITRVHRDCVFVFHSNFIPTTVATHYYYFI